MRFKIIQSRISEVTERRVCAFRKRCPFSYRLNSPYVMSGLRSWTGEQFYERGPAAAKSTFGLVNNTAWHVCHLNYVCSSFLLLLSHPSPISHFCLPLHKVWSIHFPFVSLPFYLVPFLSVTLHLAINSLFSFPTVLWTSKFNRLKL